MLDADERGVQAEIDAALAGCPNDESLLKMKILLGIRRGDSGDALDAYEKLPSGGVRYGIDAEVAYLYLESGDLQSAVNALTVALADDKAVDLLYERGKALARLGQKEAALKDLEHAWSMVAAFNNDGGPGVVVIGDDAYGADVASELIRLYQDLGRTDEAEKLELLVEERFGDVGSHASDDR